MHIENGILKGADGKSARWIKANASGGAMTPRFLVVHDTAGRLDKFSSVDWFASPKCGTSAHFVVERDGTITQMVPTNRKAFHAGQSSWKGISGLNSCSVGIEIVNPGKLDEHGVAWFGQTAKPTEIVFKGTPHHGNGWWLPYTNEQIEAVKTICRAVVEEYPDCNEILTHWEIAPKRKIDTGPLFPLREVRKAVFDPTPGEIELAPPAVPPPPVQPPPPTVVAEAARSKSVWLLLSVAMGKVGDFFFGLGDMASGWLGNTVDVLKATQTEADDAIAPLVSLGDKLRLNMGNIALWVTVGTLIVVIIRHARDKAEKKRLAALVPKPDAGD